ncbi:MAG: YraN family protein [Lachnospiraceae bacterium]|nr:YraN family protein [Lachnospiraceae bacterium]
MNNKNNLKFNKRKTGTDYEELAVNYLEKKKYFIIERNFQVRQAEIDIIARDDNTIVFIEVKYRTTRGSGHPLEAVTIQKQKRICHAALFYMNRNKISPENTSIRFDVIGILGDEITHIENAFDFIY